MFESQDQKYEMSELENSGDEDYEPEIINTAAVSEEEGEENEDEPEECPENENKQEMEEESEEEEEEEEGEKENGSPKASKTKKANVKRTCWWQKREPAIYDAQFKGQEFSVPPENPIEMTPTQYFSKFCDDNVFKYIAYHTNLYSMQQIGKSIIANEKEI